MTNLTPFLVYVLVTTFTPGPNNIMSMTVGIQNGYRRMWKFLAGIFTGFVIVMLASGLLNVVLTGLLPSIEAWLKILGVIYMGYLAYHVARSRPVEDAEGESPFNTYRFGFGMQFLNIKVILYGITVFSLFIVHTYRDPAAILGFAILLAAVSFISTSCWAVGGTLFRIFLRKNYRVFNFMMAGLLIYTAIASLF
jgi:cysteine/O-acetylserine efflux protein